MLSFRWNFQKVHETKNKNVDFEKIQTCVTWFVDYLYNFEVGYYCTVIFIVGVFKVSRKKPPEVIKAVFKNFVLLTGKHLCWSLFLIKLQARRSATLW